MFGQIFSLFRRWKKRIVDDPFLFARQPATIAAVRVSFSVTTTCRDYPFFFSAVAPTLHSSPSHSLSSPSLSILVYASLPFSFPSASLPLSLSILILYRLLGRPLSICRSIRVVNLEFWFGFFFLLLLSNDQISVIGIDWYLWVLFDRHNRMGRDSNRCTIHDENFVPVIKSRANWQIDVSPRRQQKKERNELMVYRMHTFAYGWSLSCNANQFTCISQYLPKYPVVRCTWTRECHDRLTEIESSWS